MDHPSVKLDRSTSASAWVRVRDRVFRARSCTRLSIPFSWGRMLNLCECTPFTWATARQTKGPKQPAIFSGHQPIMETNHRRIKPLSTRRNTEESRKMELALLCVLRVLCGSTRRSTRVRRVTEQVTRCECSLVRDDSRLKNCSFHVPIPRIVRPVPDATSFGILDETVRRRRPHNSR
jgi:hypothetical protein